MKFPIHGIEAIPVTVPRRLTRDGGKTEPESRIMTESVAKPCLGGSA